MTRPSLTTLLLGAAAIAVAVVAVLSVGEPEQSTAASERTVTVKRGVVQQTVSGSGTLSPKRQADVDFETSGTIDAVEVTKGEQVSKGEILGRLDDATARVSLAKARAELQSAQDTLDDVTSSAVTTTTAEGPATSTTPQITTVPDEAPTTTTPQTTTTPRTSTTPEPSAEQPAQSGGGSDQQQSQPSQQSQSPGSTMSEAAAAANVESAQLAVTEAEEALEDTVLRAPFAGTVAEVNADEGDSAGSGSSGAGGSSSSDPYVVLAQVDRFTMEVSLSESDVNSVKKGQPATVTVNAASGARFAAHVTEVDVLAAASDDSAAGGGASSSAVSYPVTLTLDQTGKKLKAGMSATADIVTAESSGLVVPNQALSGSSVTLDANGNRETRRVQTGVAGDSATIVTSGLEAGDTVVVTSSAAAAGAAVQQSGGGSQSQLQQGLQQRMRQGGGFPGGGGGGFPGGGGPAPGGARPGG